MPKAWSVLILSRHTPQAASSRLRTFQYVPYLEAAGARVIVSSFFDEKYLNKLYRSGGRSVSVLLAAYLRRFWFLRSVRNYSVIWVEKELFPFFPGIAESMLKHLGVPYIVDYDDATFHTYDKHRWAFVRGFLGNKLGPLLRGANAITAGNVYLGCYASEHGAREVVHIPTVVDINCYSVLPEPPVGEFRIGWIGTPQTVKYLDSLREPLRQLSKTINLKLVTIGAPALKDFGVPLEQHLWSQETEAQLLSSVHVGIMPLLDEPFERGKCGYKLIQYMASGRPVIASSVGVNKEIITPDVGFLAETPEDWVSAFQRLADDRALRQRMGANGRALVERDYSIQSMAPKIFTLLKRAAQSR